MMQTIFNASSIRLDQGGASPVPTVETALYGILEPVTFNLVGKWQDPTTFLVEETPQLVQSSASVQPLKVRELAIKPEGERRWTWLKIFALPDLVLTPGQVIEVPAGPYPAVPYRIMGVKPWATKGYMYYECVADYQIPEGYAFD